MSGGGCSSFSSIPFLIHASTLTWKTVMIYRVKTRKIWSFCVITGSNTLLMWRMLGPKLYSFSLLFVFHGFAGNA